MESLRPGASDSLELKEGDPGRYLASGALTFATARRGRELGLSAFGASGSREILVDCAGIEVSDSAGMTVLLDWLSFAKRTGRSLRFGNLPAQVQALARISDVLELLERGV